MSEGAQVFRITDQGVLVDAKTQDEINPDNGKQQGCFVGCNALQHGDQRAMLSRWRRSRKSAGKAVDDGASHQAVSRGSSWRRGEFIAGYSDAGTNLWHKTYKHQLFRLLTSAGHERFLPIVRSHYPRAAAVIVVYEVTDHRTFDCAKERWNDYKANTVTPNGATMDNSPPVPAMLLGNKKDLEERRKVSTEEAKAYAEEVFSSLNK
ncbi:RAB GTPase [Balamuthia mandrillaris]